MIPHNGAHNYVYWQRLDIEEKSKRPLSEHRIFEKTSICFDVCVWEVFMPLTQGSSLVILPAGKEVDATAIANYITSYHVTVAHFVPTMFALFVDSALMEECVTLEYVVAGGEALPPKVASKCRRALPNATVTNSYGPTEASIGVSSRLFDEVNDKVSVPIGKPITNTQLYIVDNKSWNAVPIGVLGELFMGGVGLARGYWNRPSLTAERFVPDPFSLAPGGGARMYASGDLCRFLSNGDVDYIRRIDFQGMFSINFLRREIFTNIFVLCDSQSTRFPY
jgi:non-ribosomal peptide synthetase component F